MMTFDKEAKLQAMFRNPDIPKPGLNSKKKLCLTISEGIDTITSDVLPSQVEDLTIRGFNINRVTIKSGDVPNLRTLTVKNGVGEINFNVPDELEVIVKPSRQPLVSKQTYLF